MRALRTSLVVASVFARFSVLMVILFPLSISPDSLGFQWLCGRYSGFNEYIHFHSCGGSHVSNTLMGMLLVFPIISESLAHTKTTYFLIALLIGLLQEKIKVKFVIFFLSYVVVCFNGWLYRNAERVSLLTL